jgi:hypothetical protein
MIKDMKLKFKQGVNGFIYEVDYGDVTAVTEPITNTLHELLEKTDKLVLFTDIPTIVECFGIDSDDLENGIWVEIFDVVE